MKWLIEDLESQISLYGATNNTGKINDLKRAMAILEKNRNIFWFPKGMVFKEIVRRGKEIVAQASPGNSSGQITQSISVVAPPSAVAEAMSAFEHEPEVGEEIFGLFKKDGKLLCCLYTWQEENNPEEITTYAHTPNGSAGVRWMPCKKNHSEKFLVICTNDCCKQPA